MLFGDRLQFDFDAEQKIIQQCQHGDIKAFKVIYNQFQQPLLGTAKRMLGHQQDAEDAVQVTFIKLFHGVKKFRFEAQFSTYLFRILVNVCFDMLKKQKKMKLLDMQKRNHTYDPTDELRLELEQAILSLPERMRVCFILFAIEDLKQSQIAEILNLNVGTVKANIFHAKMKLRKIIADDFNYKIIYPKDLTIHTMIG